MASSDQIQFILQELEGFAGAAEIHANQRHGITLIAGGWNELDRILDAERTHGDARDLESLALCYGAWIGRTLVAERKGEWVGLQEPVPPRIRLNGLCCSPIDAVRRRLRDSSAPLIQNLIDQAEKLNPNDDHLARETNRTAWDSAVNDVRFVNPQANVRLTREQALAALDPNLSRQDLTDKHVLCLAAAGGTHGPLLAYAGAKVTVVDFSRKLLEFDQTAADRQALKIRTVQADLCDLSPLGNDEFDFVIQPVSACYIRDLKPMYSEIARVLKPGGRYFSQQKSPASLQTGAWIPSKTHDVSAKGHYALTLPVRERKSLPADPAGTLPQRESGMIEYLHSIDSLLGGLCRVGFLIEEIEEPVRGDFWAPPGTAEHRAIFAPPYLKILAQKRIAESRSAQQ